MTPPAGDVHALTVRNDGLRDDLKAAEARTAFWRGIAYATSGALIGVVTGAAPMVWGGYAKAEDVVANQQALTSMSRDMASVKGALEVLISQTKPDPDGKRSK